MSGAAVEVRGLTWRPVGRARPVLPGLDLKVASGERVLLTGPSGSGKSTVLRALAGVLESSASGELTGAVTVGGLAPSSAPGLVGLVQQDPLGGIVAETVGRDVAFGLENLRVPRAEMPDRVAAALAAAHFPYGPARLTNSLSGGEAQRLALAGALAMSPRVLLLDEPTSMLDPASERAVRLELRNAIENRGITAVVVDHDLARWTDWADRIVVLGSTGRIVADGAPATVLTGPAAELEQAGLWLPGLPPPVPLQIDAELVGPRQVLVAEEPLLTLADVVVRRRQLLGDGAAAEVAYPGVETMLRPGRTLGLTGPSGSGKSTLLQVLAGVLRPDTASCVVDPRWAPRAGRRGRRLTGPWTWASRDLAGRFGWVSQLPEHAIVTSRVEDETTITARTLGIAQQTDDRRRGLLEILGLDHLRTASPYHLSGGEQRRLALVCALAHGPDVLLLDEPTVGQDRNTWAAVAGLCASAAGAGLALTIAGHDQRLLDATAADPVALAARSR